MIGLQLTFDFIYLSTSISRLFLDQFVLNQIRLVIIPDVHACSILDADINQNK